MSPGNRRAGTIRGRQQPGSLSPPLSPHRVLAQPPRCFEKTQQTAFQPQCRPKQNQLLADTLGVGEQLRPPTQKDSASPGPPSSQDAKPGLGEPLRQQVVLRPPSPTPPTQPASPGPPSSQDAKPGLGEPLGQQVVLRPSSPTPPTHLHPHPTPEEVHLGQEPPGSKPSSGTRDNLKGSSTNHQLGQQPVSLHWRQSPNKSTSRVSTSP